MSDCFNTNFFCYLDVYDMKKLQMWFNMIFKREIIILLVVLLELDFYQDCYCAIFKNVSSKMDINIVIL